MREAREGIESSSGLQKLNRSCALDRPLEVGEVVRQEEEVDLSSHSQSLFRPRDRFDVDTAADRRYSAGIVAPV